MKNIQKIIIVSIICLLITTNTTSFAFNKNIFRDNNGVDASIACYTINTKGFSTENNNLVSYENAQFLLDKIKELENEIANDPNSIKIKQLQDEIVDLAKSHKLIPNNYFLENENNQITKRYFPMSFLKNINLKTSSHASEWFCNFASVGEGSSLPVVILPRFIPILVAPIPRIYMRWEAQDGYTSCGGLLSRTGFLASGELNGFALGFWGIGFSIFLPPIMAYGLFGYALFASVNAEDIEFYPPNNKPQISNPNPSNGDENVPITLSELNFQIDDEDNDLMSYTVTTDPDIGSGSGNNKGNGFYSIPISGLQSSTTYSWAVITSDGKDTTDKTYSFTTEYLAPIVSDPIPFDGADNVQVDITQLSFTLSDPQVDLMDFTVETSPYIGYAENTSVGDGTYKVPVSGLDYFTEYNWYVNVTDGLNWNRRTFTFITLPEGVILLYPTDDTWIREPVPDDIYGSDVSLKFRSFTSDQVRNYQILIKFDLSSIGSSNNIHYAKLNLYYYRWKDNNPGGDIMKLYRAIQDWDEDTVAWNNQPSVSTQLSAQAIVPSSPNIWMEWDVTDDIINFIYGSQSNYGWLLKDVTSWSGANIPIGYFYSKEYGDNIPYLEIGVTN